MTNLERIKQAESPIEFMALLDIIYGTNSDGYSETDDIGIGFRPCYSKKLEKDFEYPTLNSNDKDTLNRLLRPYNGDYSFVTFSSDDNECIRIYKYKVEGRNKFEDIKCFDIKIDGFYDLSFLAGYAFTSREMAKLLAD